MKLSQEIIKLAKTLVKIAVKETPIKEWLLDKWLTPLKFYEGREGVPVKVFDTIKGKTWTVKFTNNPEEYENAAFIMDKGLHKMSKHLPLIVEVGETQAAELPKYYYIREHFDSLEGDTRRDFESIGEKIFKQTEGMFFPDDTLGQNFGKRNGIMVYMDVTGKITPKPLDRAELKEQTREYFNKEAGWTEEGYVEATPEELATLIMLKDKAGIAEEGGIKAIREKLEAEAPETLESIKPFLKELRDEQIQNIYKGIASFYEFEAKVFKEHRELLANQEERIKALDIDLPRELQDEDYDICLRIEELNYFFIVEYNELKDIIDETIRKNKDKLKKLLELYKTILKEHQDWVTTQFNHPQHGATLKNTWAYPRYKAGEYWRTIETIQRMLETVG